MSADERYMRRAIELAATVLTATPNPRVGCVLVRDGRVVGEGWHDRAGEAHAEVNALRAAGDLARGAVAYITLEPCCVFGRTPPCTDALIRAGVAEVVYGMQDPNPAVSGQGLRQLREAGIRVRGAILESEARMLNPGFIKRMTQGLPLVRCKMAMSLDGRTAMATGESKWITGPAAREDVQRLRAASCAVLTGVNTVIADNPSLNVRSVALASRYQPRRVIMDSSLRSPPDSRIIEPPGEVLFLVGQPHAAQRQRFVDVTARVHEVPLDTGGRIDLRAALKVLARDFACNEVMLEAGPTLSGAMVQAGLVDEVVIFVGPRFLGSEAMPLFHLPGLRLMRDHIALKLEGVEMIGGDCRIWASLNPLQAEERKG